MNKAIKHCSLLKEIVFPIKFLSNFFLVTLVLLFFSCNKESKDQPTIPQPVNSTTTFVLKGHNKIGQARILLVSLTTETTGSEKKAMLSGRSIKFRSTYGTDHENAINSAFYDIQRGTSELDNKSVTTLLEDRLKVVTGFAQTIDVPQAKLMEILGAGTAEMVWHMQVTPRNILKDFLWSLVSTPAYAQSIPTSNGIPEPDNIIIDIIKGAVNQVKNCAFGTRRECTSSILDLAKSTVDLWEYITREISKAIDPKDIATAKSVYDDITNKPASSNVGTNTQTLSPSSTGGSFGDPHLTTLDGLYYDFQGYGEFVALKSTTDAFEIQVRQEEISPYRNGKVTMNTALAVNTGSDIVCLFPNELYINKQRFTFSLSGQRDFVLKQGSATLSNNFFTIQTLNNDIIRIDIQNLDQGFIDYRVTLNDNRKGKVKGLLGNYDGDRANDAQIQNGTTINPFVFTEIYPAYANSWRISDNNSLFEYPTGKKTTDFTKTDYPKLNDDIDATLRVWAEGICRNNGITDEPYFSACVMDVALANSDRYAISALSAEENKLRLKSFDINQFTSFEALNLNDHGNPKIENGLLYLTKPRGAAAVYQKYKVDITNGFEVNIDFSFTEAGGILDAKGEVGADGIAFIIQDYNSKIVPPSAGQGLGYNGLPRSLAIEFDTFTNGGQDSPDADIWLNTQGIKPNSVADATTLIKPKTRPITNLVDGKIHKALIRYVKKTDTTYKLEVFVDGETNPYLTADDINIQNTIGAYSSGVYLGLTAATDGGYQNHIIHRWTYKPL